MKNLSTWSLIALCFSMAGAIGGGLYEHIVLTPLWNASPPSSFSIVQGRPLGVQAIHRVDSHVADEAAVRALYQELIEGWNRGSGDAFAAPFADVGSGCGTPVTIHLHVDNADAVIAGAVDAGATLEIAPKDEFYGERCGCIRDPSGHSWNIGHHIEDVSTMEMQRRYTEMLQPR